MKPPSHLGRALGISIVCLAALVASGPGEALSGDGGTPPQPPPRRPVVKTRKIAPGLLFTKIVQRQIPRRTFVLRMNPAQPVTLDVALSEPALPARRVLSRVAKAHGAIAAVNGDYGGDPIGDPIHPLAQDGELLQTSSQFGVLFAISQDETQTFFGRPDVAITLTERASGRIYRVDRWNDGPPALGEIVGYSPLGGSLEPPPPFSCSIRLLPTGPPTLAQPDGVDRDYVVDGSGCSDAPFPRNGGVVLAAEPATDEATQLLALAPGAPVRLHWTFGWAGVLDAVGGAPLLVQDGQLVDLCNSGCGSQPRTGIGVTAKGWILLVVVDGRQPRWSLGPTMDEFARMMRDLGAVTALNLDGGGSSEMVVNGEVVNRPSDGQQRPISNAVLVLPGPDPGEP